MSLEDFRAMKVGDRHELGIVTCVLDDVDGRAVVAIRGEGSHRIILQRIAGTTEVIVHS